MKPSGGAIAALLDGTHADPFSLLGIHEGPQGAFARAVLPGAEVAEAYDLSGKKLGKLKRVYAHPMGMSALMSGWLPAESTPDPKVVDWNMYLGPASWRPYNEKLLDGFNFEKGGGLVGGGVLEWGSHCVDLCQWAVDADGWTRTVS